MIFLEVRLIGFATQRMEKSTSHCAFRLPVEVLSAEVSTDQVVVFICILREKILAVKDQEEKDHDLEDRLNGDVLHHRPSDKALRTLDRLAFEHFFSVRRIG